MAKVGAGVWIRWTDGLESEDGRVGLTVVCKRRDGWRVFRSHLGTGCMDVYDAELCAIGLALWELVQTGEALQTHRVTKVAHTSISYAAIR